MPRKQTKLEKKNKPKSTPSENLPYGRVVSWIFVLASLGAAIYYGGLLNRAQPELANPSDEFQDVYERDASIFRVEDLPGRGKGVIAVRDIRQGELVVREEPLFTVPHSIAISPTALMAQSLRKLSYEDRERFYNLSYVHFPPELDPKEYPDEVALAIFQTNAVAAGDAVGIFPRMARLNHGCSSAFNVVYSWREKEGVLTVHALKDIRKGQELLTTYGDTKRPRDERREFLKRQYDFTCTCAVCSLDEESSRASDRRIIAISDYYNQFAAWGTNTISGAKAIRIIRKIWELEEEEGYWSERGRLAADAAWIAASHSDASAAREWTQESIRWYAYELGADSEQVVEMKTILEDPTRHHAWGSREKMDVGGLR